jgi:sodium-dependent multivitamin transporter 6
MHLQLSCRFKIAKNNSMSPLIGLVVLDYVVLLFYLAGLLAIGYLFSRRQHDSQEFFLAGRSMGWLPVGLSLMATLLSALSYTGIPGQGYEVGMRCLLMPLSIWLILPVIHLLVIPIYRGLELTSIYEYLEMRYDARVRLLGSGVFVVWRLLWLGGVLYAPCKALAIATGLTIPMPVLLLVLGVVSTIYTFLGGMRAVIWTDVVQAVIMFGGVIFITLSVWSQLDGGSQRVWTIAETLGRSEVLEPPVEQASALANKSQGFDWTQKWNPWGFIPHFALAMFSFYIADQITAQRFLTTKNVASARWSFLLNCVAVSVLMSALTYVGMCMLAFYFDNPNEMDAKWVANVDPVTRKTREVDGAKALDWHDDPVNSETLPELIENGRLLRPNRNTPITSPEQVTGENGTEIQIENLAIRRPRKTPLDHGEFVVNLKSIDELMPRYISRHLPMGVAGLLLAALLAASMSSMDSGLNSISTLVVTDFYRKSSWAKQPVAKTSNEVGKEKSNVASTDGELAFGRKLVIVVGVSATLFSFLVSQIGDIFSIMIGVINTFGGPLAAVIFLGMITRRGGGLSAMIAMIFGMWFSIWIYASNKYEALEILWPFGPIHEMWTITLGFPVTLAVCWLGGFIEGQVKSKQQLEGLVWGIGSLGKRNAKVVAAEAGESKPDDEEMTISEFSFLEEADDEK